MARGNNADGLAPRVVSVPSGGLAYIQPLSDGGTVERYAHMDSDKFVQAETLTADNATIVSVWAHAVVVQEIDPFDPEMSFPGLNVQCGDQVKRASLGDKVILHDDGTYDVLKPIEFSRRYMHV